MTEGTERPKPTLTAVPTVVGALILATADVYEAKVQLVSGNTSPGLTCTTLDTATIQILCHVITA